jgi:hypothetical protein
MKAVSGRNQLFANQFFTRSHPLKTLDPEVIPTLIENKKGSNFFSFTEPIKVIKLKKGLSSYGRKKMPTVPYIHGMLRYKTISYRR